MMKLISAGLTAAVLSLPGAAAAETTNPVGVRRCGWGLNFIVHYYDLEGQYHELADTCK